MERENPLGPRRRISARMNSRRRDTLIAGALTTLALLLVLWCPDEHLDEIIVQAVVEHALEDPLEVGMVEVPRMQRRGIRVHVHRGVRKMRLEADDQFHAFARRLRRELQQRMLVEAQLLADTFHAFHTSGL